MIDVLKIMQHIPQFCKNRMSLKKSGSQVMGRNNLDQSDSRFFQI